MFYMVRSLVCDMTWTELCDCWKIAFRWDVVKCESFKRFAACGRLGCNEFACPATGPFYLFDLVVPSQLQPPPPSLPVAPASSPVPPHLLRRLQASLYSQPTSRARFTDHSAATDSNGLKKKVRIKGKWQGRDFKCPAAYLANSLAVPAHFREEQDKMNVNVLYLIIGTHKNTMSNFRSITKKKKKIFKSWKWKLNINLFFTWHCW